MSPGQQIWQNRQKIKIIFPNKPRRLWDLRILCLCHGNEYCFQAMGWVSCERLNDIMEQDYTRWFWKKQVF